jgi:hypothetical protein
VYDTRTIAFICELMHPHSQPDTGAVQRVHNGFFQDGDPPYTSFAITPMGPVLTNPSVRPGAVSQAVFLPDRFQFREELGALTCDDFAARVRQVTEAVTAQTGLQDFSGQQVTIRSLINPRHYRDSRDLLKEGLFRVQGSVSHFENDPAIWGLRMVFPPQENDPEIPEFAEDPPTANALRIESYAQDPRSLFLENQGSFGQIAVNDGLDILESNITSAYEFLTERGLSFVASFDQSN